MLRSWQSHQQYQEQLLRLMIDFYQSIPDLVLYHQDQIKNLYDHNLDSVSDLLTACYSSTGALARLQAQLLRSFFLMSKCQVFRFPTWVVLLVAIPILKALAGYSPGTKSIRRVRIMTWSTVSDVQALRWSMNLSTNSISFIANPLRNTPKTRSNQYGGQALSKNLLNWLPKAVPSKIVRSESCSKFLPKWGWNPRPDRVCSVIREIWRFPEMVPVSCPGIPAGEANSVAVVNEVSSTVTVRDIFPTLMPVSAGTATMAATSTATRNTLLCSF